MDSERAHAAKVPEVTLAFWLIKITATTLGETGGDAVSMSMGLGYVRATAIFATIFAVFVAAQVRAPRYRPFLYWTTIVATTAVGTTIADFVTRDLGIGYAGGSAVLAALVGVTLAVWRRALGTVSVASVATPVAEIYYWVTIMFSQTLGTALGDWTADTNGLGYGASALLFGALLAVVAAFKYMTSVTRTGLFWAAFVLTRPLGAVLGDLLDKPVAKGGLELSRYGASAALLAVMLALILAVPSRAAGETR